MNFKKYSLLRKRAFSLVARTSVDEMRHYSPIKNQPYWTHLMNVHNFLITKGETDYEMLLSAILHDVLEDTKLNKKYLHINFTGRVAEIVDVVTKRDNYDGEEYYNNILNQKDSAASKIKVADRIDNILTHSFYRSDKQYLLDKYNETVKYILPLAKKIGWDKDLKFVLFLFKKHF